MTDDSFWCWLDQFPALPAWPIDHLVVLASQPVDHPDHDDGHDEADEGTRDRDPLVYIQRQCDTALSPEQRALVMIRTLAPPVPDSPPPDLVEQFEQEAVHDNPWPVAVVLGAGVGRSSPWPENTTVWDRPFEVLRRIMAARIAKSTRVLRKQVRGFEDHFPYPREDGHLDRWADQVASRLALVLITGNCGCGHHQRPCAGPDQGCRCCTPWHRLANWDHRELLLGIFATNAVRGLAPWGLAGSPYIRVKGDAFSRSLLLGEIDRVVHGGLRVGNLEFRRCAGCEHRFERREHDDVCPHCHTTDDVHRNRREARKNLILLTDLHEQVTRVVCRACGNLIDDGRVLRRRSGCPLSGCGHTAQLKCPRPRCEGWLEVGRLTEPCTRCGTQLTIPCGGCGRTWRMPDVLGDRARHGVAAVEVLRTECHCGYPLIESLDRRVLQLCRTRQLWVLR